MSEALRHFRRNIALTALLCLGLVGFIGVTAVNNQSGTKIETVSYDYDYWTQIVEHRIPEVRDGAARYFPGGRYYTGPNGLEVRFTSQSTQVLAGIVAATGGYVVAGEALVWAANNTTPMIATALKKAPEVIKVAAGGAAEAFVTTYIPGDQCLGMTLPSQWVVDYLNGSWNNLEAVGSGEIPLGFGYNVPVWLEPCS